MLGATHLHSDSDSTLSVGRNKETPCRCHLTCTGQARSPAQLKFFTDQKLTNDPYSVGDLRKNLSQLLVNQLINDSEYLVIKGQTE
jgi:hypothetical protein